MTTLLISLAAIGAALVGLKVYLQEKNKLELKEAIRPEEKTAEQVVYERLQEIAKFESETQNVELPVKNEVVKADSAAPKEKVGRKKPNSYRKHKPKAKNKQ